MKVLQIKQSLGEIAVVFRPYWPQKSSVLIKIRRFASCNKRGIVGALLRDQPKEGTSHDC